MSSERSPPTARPAAPSREALYEAHMVSSNRAKNDGIWCYFAAFSFARRAGLDQTACWEIGIAAAELVANAIRQAGGGLLVLRTIETPHIGVEIIVSDRGPGTADVAPAGFRARLWRSPSDFERDGGGLAPNIATVRRLMSEVEVQISPIEGTTVTARKWDARTA